MLTRAPSSADESRVPHRLYGHAPVDIRYFRRRLAARCRGVLNDAARASVLAIVVGGTGLYFKALTEGLWRDP